MHHNINLVKRDFFRLLKQFLNVSFRNKKFTFVICCLFHLQHYLDAVLFFLLAFTIPRNSQRIFMLHFLSYLCVSHIFCSFCIFVLLPPESWVFSVYLLVSGGCIFVLLFSYFYKLWNVLEYKIKLNVIHTLDASVWLKYVMSF